MIEQLITEINLVFNVDILAKTRKRNFVEGRCAFGFIMHKLLKFKSEYVGEVIGKDHATILHYVKQHKNLMKYDRFYREKFEKIDLENYILVKQKSKNLKNKILILNKIMNLENKKQELIRQYVT